MMTLLMPKALSALFSSIECLFLSLQVPDIEYMI